MKKLISVILVSALLISLSGTSVFAFSGRGIYSGDSARQQRITRSELWQQSMRQGELEICSVEDCTIRGVHEHDGVYYRCSYYCTETRRGLGIGRGRGTGGRGTGGRGRGMNRGTGLRDGSCIFR